MNDMTKKAMTLEDVRDWMRRLEKQHDLIPPLREAYGSAADAINTHLSVQCNSSLIDVYDRLEKVEMDKKASLREGEAVAFTSIDDLERLHDDGGGIGRVEVNSRATAHRNVPLYISPPHPNLEVTEKLVKAIADKVCRYNNSRYQPWSDSNSPHYGDAEYFVRRVLESANITLPTVSDEMIDAALTAYEEFTGQEADYEGIQKALEAVLSEKGHE